MKKLIAFLFVTSLLLIKNIPDKPSGVNTDPMPKNWMDVVIHKEFVKFKKGITKAMINDTYRECTSGPTLGACKQACFKRYKIIARKVYGEEAPIKKNLEMIAEKYPVPDVDIIYYNHDTINSMFYNINKKYKKAPIFVSAKEKDMNRLILFVDWYYDIKDENNGLNKIAKSINDYERYSPWEKKIDQAFWRGTPADGYYNWNNWTVFPRGRLIQISMQYPDMVDAAFTDYQPWQVDDVKTFDRQLSKMPFVSPVDQLRYKYQLDIDGVTSCYTGTQWKLLSGCLVLKQHSPDMMWFSDQLVPWKHYVPLYTDLRDLIEKIQWARNHDQEARRIAKQGRDFALENFNPEQVLMFCYKTLLKYASLQKFKPTVNRKEKKEENKRRENNKH